MQIMNFKKHANAFGFNFPIFIFLVHYQSCYRISFWKLDAWRHDDMHDDVITWSYFDKARAYVYVDYYSSCTFLVYVLNP